MNHAFSIILTVYDQAHDLEEYLPAILEQAYEPGYEVIVVDESSTDETPDVLKLLKSKYPHLYSTFLPKPNRQVIRRKQAFNIGVKAAKNEWIIITKLNHQSIASDVLKAISEQIDNHTSLTLGYHLKKGIRLQPFFSVDEARQHIRRAERRLKTVRERKYGNYMWGRYDFIILKKEYAYDLLNLFEQSISGSELFGIRLGILWKNLWSRPSTTLLVSE